MTPSKEQLLTPAEVVERWKNIITVRTLANWRSQGVGPAFVKISDRALYRVEDIQAYENRHSGGDHRPGAGQNRGSIDP